MYDISAFESQYFKRRHALDAAVRMLSEYVAFALEDERVLFHDVAFRVKKFESAQRKILDKQYDAPWEQMMDLIGGRVFTYFKDDSSLVEEVIRNHFDVDEEHSINKASSLMLNEFGYISRHLICAASGKTQDLKLRSALKDLKFEIQIRTVLEHGWAEVEHELVYKARTLTPDPVRRRFAASAAALELIELEFARLRDFEPEMISERTTLVESSPMAELDRAWLIATLRHRFPDRETWNPNPRLDNFYRGHEITILSFLTGQGINTVSQWDELLKSPEIGECISSYAAKKGIPVDTVNHLPIATIACAAVASHLPGTFDAFLDDEVRDVTTDLYTKVNAVRAKQNAH